MLKVNMSLPLKNYQIPDKNKVSNKVDLSAPWEEYAKKVEALFEFDPEITVKFKDLTLNVYVESHDKYEALINLMPEKKKFGNVSIVINIYPSNKVKNDAFYIANLFKGNENITQMREVTVGTNPMFFVEFKKQVVQYYTDNLADLHGNRTTVMEQIAREVFDDINGVYFCTDNSL